MTQPKQLHTPKSPPNPAPKVSASSAADRATDKPRRRLASALRGVMWGSAAFLLGSCPTLLDAAPLGLGLLAAASSYTWYILGGLLLSASLHPVGLSGWAWTGVYLLCVILRLTIRFFVDPPTLPDGRPCRGRTYLRLCWASFKQNADLLPRGDTDYTDYYPGSDPRKDVTQKAAASSDPLSTDLKRGAPESNFRPRLFWEHPFLRMLTAAVSGLMAGLFGVITGGFHLYDLLTALVLLLFTPVATFLLVACFGEAGMTLLFSSSPLGQGDKPSTGEAVTRKFHAFPLCSVCFLLFCVVFAAREFSPMLGTPYLTISLATLLGLILTLTAAARLGTIPGLAVGVICGLAAAPSLSPIFILCAGVYALLATASPRLGALGGCLAGGAWCWGVEGIAVILPLLPAILLAPPLFLLTERLSRAAWLALPTEEAGRETERDDLRDITELLSSVLSLESRSKAGEARMKALSEAFDSLSKRFYSLSDQLKRPRLLDLRNICDESFGRQCARCRNRDICWGAEYDRTLEAQARLTAQLHGGGRADAAGLPDSLRDFCPHMEALVADINSRCARMTENLLRCEQTDLFAADYAAMAALLTEALEEDRREAHDFTCNREAADAIYDHLTHLGVAVQGVVVGGKQSRRQRVIVRGEDFDTILPRMDEVKADLEDICGTSLTPPVFETEERGVVMTLCSEAALSAEYAGSTVPFGRREAPLPPPLTHETPAGGYIPPAVCGDHIAAFRTEGAYLYALISDGMGTGEDASLTSDICTMFLEKMLTAGNKVDISLRMLDTYLRSKNRGRGEECSATVDLMELDLMDGQAVFAKNGAAPTYVVREGKVYKLDAPTLPIGILSDTPRKSIRFRTHPGDVVVMVSDGVTMGNDECPWLLDLLSSPMPGSMDSLRADIIKRALSAGSEDDLSAIAIRVKE